MNNLLVSVIQTDLFWEDKTANLAMLEEKLATLPHTELVVLPEMFSTGFSMQPALLAEPMDGPTINWMKQMAAKYRIILTGSVIIAEEGDYFNRLIWMLPNGQLGYYDKRHLFAYAGENQHFSAGNKRLIASAKGWKINLQICFDLRFPVWSRQSITPNHQAPEYDLLLYVANWPERRSLAWKTLLQARAIENQCYVVGVNRVGHDGNGVFHSGDSMIVGPLGEIIYQAPPSEAIYTHSLSQEALAEARGKFPFWKEADTFHINP